MSQFPAVRPSGRSFTPGSLPVEAYTSMSGKETRVVMGNTFFGHSVSLDFQNLQEAVVQTLIAHFYEQQGTVLSFTLPSAVWAGWSLYESAVSSSQKWRYAGTPSVQAVSPGIMSISVELIALA